MANSLRDANDPDQAIHRRMVEFSRLVKDRLAHAIAYRYENVPGLSSRPVPLSVRRLAIRDGGSAEEVIRQSGIGVIARGPAGRCRYELPSSSRK